jgi:hypothetical protein
MAHWPDSGLLESLEGASAFFRRGAIGYSPSARAGEANRPGEFDSPVPSEFPDTLKQELGTEGQFRRDEPGACAIADSAPAPPAAICGART